MIGRWITRLGDRAFGPMNAFLARRNVPPVLANALQCTAAAAGGLCLASGHTWVGIALVAAHGLFDYLDGGLRRASGRGSAASPSALWTHAAADKLSDLALVLLPACTGLVNGWLSAVAAAASVAATALGFWAQHKGICREAALFDRSDRVAAFMILAALGRLSSAIVAIAVLALIVTGQRTWRLLAAAGKQRPRALPRLRAEKLPA